MNPQQQVQTALVLTNQLALISWYLVFQVGAGAVGAIFAYRMISAAFYALRDGYLNWIAANMSWRIARYENSLAHVNRATRAR